MLAACAARLASRSNMVWVDLGGGTGVSRYDATNRKQEDISSAID